MSIKTKIFFSQIAIMATALALTFLALNLCLDIYINKQTIKQIEAAGDTIKTALGEVAKPITNKKAVTNNDFTKELLKLNKTLKSKINIDTNYVILSDSNNIVFPEKSSEEYKFVEQNLIPNLEIKKWFKSSNISEYKFSFNTIGKRYRAIIYNLKLSNNREGYLVVYSDVFKTKGFVEIVNSMLLLILLITGAMSVILSNNVAYKISQPIQELSMIARKIGNRQYDASYINYNSEDEIGQLAKTMTTMAQSLQTYDNTMKGFVQNASHELRTPLMSIQGYAEGIKYGVFDDNSDAVNIIIDESKRLSDLVNDLLYLSKIEAINETINFEEINADHLVRSAIERVNGIALSENKKIIFANKIGTEMLLGDEEKLTRAIINILGNCLRYCNKEIEVLLDNEKEDGQCPITIIIKDDGPGLDEKDINNIFNRFYKGEGGNYGLGLAITKSIIEKHNGKIFARNAAAGGAEFTITLPAEKTTTNL